MKRTKIRSSKELVCSASGLQVYYSNSERTKIERKKYIINQLKK